VLFVAAPGKFAEALCPELTILSAKVSDLWRVDNLPFGIGEIQKILIEGSMGQP
jgi:hypothetical protein